MEQIIEYHRQSHTCDCNDSRTKVILFYGMENTNMVLYLSRVLSQNGKYILVIDNTSEQYLAECIPSLKNAREEVLYREVSYFHHKSYDEILFKKYDVVICLNGYHRDSALEETSHQIYVVTDFQKIKLSDTVSLVKHLHNRYVLIYFNCVESYIDNNYVEFSFAEAKRRIIQRFFIPLSENDFACALKMQYNSTFHIAELSREYQKMIYVIIKSLFPENRNRYIEG